MKIPIIDLMDLYYDDSVKLERPEKMKKEGETWESAEAPKGRRGYRLQLIAAGLLVVVSVAAILPTILSRTSGGSAVSSVPSAPPVLAEESSRQESEEALESDAEAAFGALDQESFFELFWELDRDSTEAYLSQHPEALEQGWGGIDINESAIGGEGTEITTIYGDKVLAVNAGDGVLLIRAELPDTKGVLAICKDSSRLSLCPAESLGVTGQTVGEICEANHGVLAMTGSAFWDNGESDGGSLSGLAVCGGTAYGTQMGSGFKRLELRQDGYMYIVDSNSDVAPDTRDAVEFQPALIVDGALVVDENTFYNSPNPRAVIGQNSRKEVMLLVAEGRFVDSIGCSVVPVAELLKQYGCKQALNLDGGTSAILYYQGEPVTRCSNQDLPEGRKLPTAWVYRKNS